MTMSLAAARAFADAYTAAWNSGSAAAVASHFAADGGIIINRGTPWEGREGVHRMADGFFADVNDMRVTCNDVRAAGDHVAYFWTFTGRHAGTGHPLAVVGWEEWDFDSDGKVKASRGWFDGEDYARQVAGG